jgi:L-lactate utilization protein LutB
MTDTNSLFSNDPALKDVDRAKWNPSVDDATVTETAARLEAVGHNVIVVANRAEALEAVKKIPKEGQSVSTAGSTTLSEIGLVDYLKGGQHGWRNIKEEILNEKDEAKQAELRRTLGTTPDYHLTSVGAIAKDTGAMFTVDLTGTRTGPFLYGPSHVIVVVGQNKIVKDDAEANARQREYCLSVESARVRIAFAAMGVKASAINFEAVVRAQNPFSPEKRYTVILVKETLGF